MSNEIPRMNGVMSVALLEINYCTSPVPYLLFIPHAMQVDINPER
jgi:hypothetical protein